MLEALDIADLVHLAPVLPYLETLREMMDAHGLLVFQAGNCNHQTPAKLYEYLRAGKPILAMTDPAGDTAAALRAGGFDDAHIAPIEREAEIARLLVAFLDAQRAGGAPGPDMSRVRTWSRAGQSEVLAALFSTVLSA
jgi:hypothetical protein